MGNTQADFVELALGTTETTETTLGTITIPSAGVKKIIGVYGIAEMVTTTAESVAGFFRLAFKTIPGVFRFPVTVFSAPAGTLTSPAVALSPNIIPVNIDVPANEAVTVTMALNIVSSGAARGMVGLIFE